MGHARADTNFTDVNAWDLPPNQVSQYRGTVLAKNYTMFLGLDYYCSKLD
jgi:hypothetical protein